MTELPDGLHAFLEQAGWQAASIAPLPGDASFRRYFRLRRDAESAMLMHAPPPHEDPKPFLRVARYLTEHGLRAPVIFAADAEAGWVLTEDFGDERLKEHLDDNPDAEQDSYAAAVDTLIELHRKPAGAFAPYDLEAYLREVDLFPEWWAQKAGLAIDTDSWRSAWTQVLSPLVDRQRPGVTVLRDYHAENIMLPADGGQGLIDFQDALVGHPAYDLVSLLQDARRDVPESLEAEMIARYVAKASPGDDFHEDYARLGAQRNAKIVGIFTRLSVRDGKDRYLSLIPRVWRAMERDLRSPALAPVAQWFDDNIPPEIRRREGALA